MAAIPGSRTASLEITSVISAGETKQVRQATGPKCGVPARSLFYKWLWLPLVILASVGPCRSAWAQDAQKRVLVLYSTSREAQISITGERELPRVLNRGMGRSLDYYAEYIDLARFEDPGYQEAFRNFLRVKYSGQHFDVVIAMLDVAIEFVGKVRDDLFPGVPVVFFAFNPVAHPLPNSAGAIARQDFSETILLARELQPEVRQVFVVSGGGARDKVFETSARTQFKSLEPGFAFTYLSGLPTDQLEQRLAALPAQSVIFYLIVYQDGRGQNFQPIDYLDRISRVANRPIYSWVESALDHGVVGGSMQGLDAQVDAVADLAVRVLRGEPAESIGTVALDLHVNQVDWRQLRRWGISQTRLSAGTRVLFEAPDVWDRYKGYILGATSLVMIQAGLIVGLLVQASKRRRAEEQVRASRSELQASHTRIQDLGRRLLSAQEEERANIARELHDDISQQLAVLSMDLQMLNRRAAKQSGDVDGFVQKALSRTRSIVNSVRDISHRLHPAKLKIIGLGASLDSLQQEFSGQGLIVSVSHENVPDALAHDVTLCLFRIVQEALQNAIKHSGAREVLVNLRGNQDALVLTITDDGMGFDVAEAWGRGLGLISMGERLESLGGTLKIQSRPGAGTRLEIIVAPSSQPAAVAV